MKEELLQKAIGFIQERFKNDSSGHDFYHSMRVYRTAENICREEGGKQEIVQLAALLHDVDDYKLFGGQVSGYSEAEKFLRSLEVSEEHIEEICSIISKISYKGTGTQIPDSLEGKIVQDADRLDAIGAIGIARAFAYGGSRGRAIYIPEEKPREHMDFEAYANNKGASINHFYEKLLRLKDLMNTETGKRMAIHRHEYMLEFLEEFYQEWDGNL